MARRARRIKRKVDQEDPVLSRNTFYLDESMGLFRAAFGAEIRDKAEGIILLICREQNISRTVRFWRFADMKRITPFDLLLCYPDGNVLLRIRRGAAFWSSRVRVETGEGVPLGMFVLRPFSICGAFDVLDAAGIKLCRLQGSRLGWRFRFITGDGTELARVEKVWAGWRKELFSCASDYRLRIDPAVGEAGVLRRMMLAAGLCIGMVAKVEV